MELILKRDNSVEVAIRHYAHTVRGQLHTFDEIVSNQKQALSDEFPLDALDDMYPSDMFERHANVMASRIGDAYLYARNESTGRELALYVQHLATMELIRIETDVTSRQGQIEEIDEIIEDCLNQMMALASVSAFIDKSRDARSERVQELLEAPSPSRACGLMKVDLVQSAIVKEVVDSIEQKALAELDEEGEKELTASQVEKYLDMSLDMLDDILLTDFKDVAKTNCLEMFEPNDARDFVINKQIPSIDGKLYSTMSTKVERALRSALVGAFA